MPWEVLLSGLLKNIAWALFCGYEAGICVKENLGLAKWEEDGYFGSMKKKRTLLKIARADVFFQVFFSKIRCSIRIALWVNHLALDLHGGYQLSSVTIPFYPEYVMSKSHTVMICWPMDDWDAAIILTPQIMSALTSDKVTAASGARNWCFPIRAHRGKEPGVPVWLWIALFHEMSQK